MASIFTKIINREIPGYIVAENDDCIAFLDINPLVRGHCLAVPKKEIDNLFDLDDDTYAKLQMFVKKVAVGIQQAIPCNRVGIVVIGLEIPHAHIHLIPINQMNDINFSNPKLKLSEEELAQIAGEIKSSIK